MISSTMRERPVSRSRIITLSGSVGAGKSTLLKTYEEYLLRKGEVYPIVLGEKVDGNGLLKAMYEDPKRWTFTLQVDFMLHKYEMYKRAASLVSRSTDILVMIERDFSDFLVFAEFQFKRQYMTSEEYDTYLSLYKVLNVQLELVAPRGGITNYYLDTPIDICSSRVLERGRSFELGICDDEYLLQMNNIQKKNYDSRNSIAIPHDYTMETLDDIILGSKPLVTRSGVFDLGGVIVDENSADNREVSSL